MVQVLISVDLELNLKTKPMGHLDGSVKHLTPDRHLTLDSVWDSDLRVRSSPDSGSPFSRSLLEILSLSMLTGACALFQISKSLKNKVKNKTYNI